MRNNNNNERNTMIHVSDITLPAHVETTTDAVQVLSNERQRNAYIVEFGNVAVELDTFYRSGMCWKVPVFETKREVFTAAKARDCAKHGCE